MAISLLIFRDEVFSKKELFNILDRSQTEVEEKFGHSFRLNSYLKYTTMKYNGL